MNKIVLMAIIIGFQLLISMTTTPSLIKLSKSDSDMTMGQSWPIALVQMLLMILGFVLVSYLGTESEKVGSSD
jgi:hypothetical protein